MDENMLCVFGSEVKASEGGHLTGYLVRFSGPGDPDTSGDYFTKETDFDLSNVKTVPVYVHHTLPMKTRQGKTVQITEKVGEGTLTVDEEGVLIDAILYNHSRYKSALEKAIKSLGWSSGTAPHLVERKAVGQARHITRWPLGLDASLTPTPAEPRNVAELKSMEAPSIELEPEAEAEGSDAAEAVTETPTQPTEPKESEMTQEEINKAVADALAAKEAEAKRVADEQAAFDKRVADAVKAALEPINKGLKAGAPALNLKTKPGDDAFKAFGHYVATGDAGGIRTGEAYESFLKTDYHLLEGAQYQGQEAVPTEVYAGIVERRNQLSVARAAGAMVVPAKSNAINIPIEKTDPQAHGTLSIDGTNTFTTMTAQPLDKLAMTIYTFTYNVPVDINLLDDSVFGIDGWLSRLVSRGLALTENTYMLMGTGSSQPQGAIYASTKGVDAASASAVTAAEIVKLYYTLAAEYRDNVAWVMAGATEAAVRNLTVDKEFPFVGNGGTNGGVGNGGQANGAGWLVAPNSRVFNSSACDAIAASKKVVMVGNFEAGFAIADRKFLTVLRDPYSEASKGLVNLWWYSRWSSGVTNAAALQHILTPTG